MEISHIGYAVKNINDSILAFEKLGFALQSEIYRDEKRNIFICFMNNQGIVIELISPIGKGSPVDLYLRKIGNTPYHLCYKTDSLQSTATDLVQQGFTVLAEPSEAVAFQNQKVAFFMHLDLGIIEVVETEFKLT